MARNASSSGYTVKPLEVLERRELLCTPVVSLSHADLAHPAAEIRTLLAEEEERQDAAPDMAAVMHAAEIQRQFHFYNGNGNFYEDDTIQGSRWFQDGNAHQWYLAMPTGEIYRFFGRSLGESQRVATVHPWYYDHLPAFFAEEAPQASEAAAHAEEEAEENVDSDPLLSTAAELQRMYGFAFNRSYYQNEFGFNEKALYTGDGRWAHVRPDGSLYFSGGTHVFIAQLSPVYHENPELLFRAEERWTAVEAVDAVLEAEEQDVCLEESAPAAVSSVSPNTGADAEAEAQEDLERFVRDAAEVQRQFRFYNSNGNFYEDDTIHGSRWFQSGLDDQWYVAMPTGEIYRFFGRSLGESVLVARVDPFFYAHLPEFFAIGQPETVAQIRAMKAEEDARASVEALEPPPVITVTALGGHQAVFIYEGVGAAGMRILVIPAGRQTYDQTYFERDVPQGSGTVRFFLPPDVPEKQVEAVFFHPVQGREIAPRIPFAFEASRFTRIASSMEDLRHDEMGQVWDTGVRTTLRGQFLLEVGNMLAPIPVRDRLAAKLPQVFGATEAEDDAALRAFVERTTGSDNPQQMDFVYRNTMDVMNSTLESLNLALNTAQEMIGNGLVAAFEGMIAGGRGRALEEEVARAMRAHRDAAVVAEFIPDLPSAADLVRTVETHCNRLYERYDALVGKQNTLQQRALTEATAAALAIPPAEEPFVSRLLELNRARLEVAWRDMGLSSEQIADRLSPVASLQDNGALRYAETLGTDSVLLAQRNSITDVEPMRRTFSFLVSRPLQGAISGAYFSHNFIAVGAHYRGDPNARIYSFGATDEGYVGQVNFCTKNYGSNATYQADIDAWRNLEGKPYDYNGTIQVQLIPAPDAIVEYLAQSFDENQDYAMLASIFGANSNSAAQAIANAAAGMAIPTPGTELRWSLGVGDAGEIIFEPSQSPPPNTCR